MHRHYADSTFIFLREFPHVDANSLFGSARRVQKEAFGGHKSVVLLWVAIDELYRRGEETAI